MIFRRHVFLTLLTGLSVGQAETPESCSKVIPAGSWFFDVKTSTCLYFSKAKSSWTAAQETCRTLKSNLVTVPDMDTYDFVRVKAAEFVSNQTLLWIGLFQVQADWTSIHTWIDGQVRFFRAWDFNEPNANAQERCVAHDSKTERWKDANCGRALQFICQRSDRTRPAPTPPPAITPGNCQPNWTEYDGACYYFSGPTNKTFYEAYLLCTQDLSSRMKWPRADLVSIHSSLENDFIIGETRKSHYRHQKTPVQPSGQHPDVDRFDFWIGMHDNMGDKLVVWTDQTPVDYENWHISEPGTLHPDSCIDFGTEFERVGRWKNVGCLERRGYVCKGPKNVDAPAPPAQPPSRCPVDFVPLGDTCLKFLSLAAGEGSWSKAQSRCQAASPQADIATIADIYENAEIRVLLNEYMQFAQPQLSEATVWIGMQEHEGSYAWQNSCPVTFTNFEQLYWKPVQDLSCVQMTADGRWVAANCDSQANFVVCEKRIVSCPAIHDSPDPYMYCHEDFPMECGRSCYRIESERSTHPEDKAFTIETAQAECEARGGNLASIRTKNDQSCLSEHVKYSTQGMWIGLKGVENLATGSLDWKWGARDGSQAGDPITFVNWHSDASQTDRTKLCATISSDGSWMNQPCTNTTETSDFGYICEMVKERHDVPRWTTTVAPNPAAPGNGAVAEGALSAGTIAGIVCGAILAVALVGSVLFIYKTRYAVNSNFFFPTRTGSTADIRPLESTM